MKYLFQVSLAPFSLGLSLLEDTILSSLMPLEWEAFLQAASAVLVNELSWKEVKYQMAELGLEPLKWVRLITGLLHLLPKHLC